MNRSNLFDLARNVYTKFSYNNSSGKALIPLRYFLELTYRCNLQCPYCYVGNERNKNELSILEWENVIKQIPIYGIITLVGGEPFIRSDFDEILGIASKRVLGKVHIVSNGVLLNEDRIKALKKYKPILLSVSLDGFGKNHDTNRCQEGIFDKIVNNLENLRIQNPKQMVDIKTIVLENNLDDLPELYKLCDDMKFNFLSISFLRNNNWKQNSILQESFIPEYTQNYPIKQYFDMERFKEIYLKLTSMSKKSNVKIRFAPKFEYSENPLESIEKFFGYPEDKQTNEIYKPCTYPYSDMMINPEGFVYPCLAMKIGNVKDKKLIELYNDPKYRCFRKNLKASGGTFGACQMCCECKIK